MGRGAAVTDFERGQIKALAAEGLSDRCIAATIGRSPKLVNSCRKRGVDNAPGTSTGRKRKLSDRDVRQIRREASNASVTSFASHCHTMHQRLRLSTVQTYEAKTSCVARRKREQTYICS